MKRFASARHTLLGHAFVLIALLIVLSLATVLAIIHHVEAEPRSRQMAQLLTSVVNLTRAAMLSSDPIWRDALLAELRDAEDMHVELGEASDVIEPLPARPPELQHMAEHVRASLGERTRVTLARNGEAGLWVSFFIGEDEFWIGLPRERIEHPLSRLLVVLAGVVLLFALLGAYLIARRVARPLKQLAQAAGQVGKGEMPMPMAEQGSSEVIELTRAFNRMASDLSAHERERALVLAGISHDLRTPLTRVRLAAELSKESDLREGLNADVDQMEAIIAQFLDYARLDENETAALTDLADLLRATAAQFEARAKNIRLEIPDLPEIELRPMLLRRAIANLLDNAIKYGGADITMVVKLSESELLVTVMDRGAGIDAAQYEAVKRPFVRLNAARSDTSGAGLGLAIVERAARLHGGRFELKAVDGGGLAAQVTLPLKR